MNRIYFTRKDIAPICDKDALSMTLPKEANEEDIKRAVRDMDRILAQGSIDTLYFTAFKNDDKDIICEGECLNGNVIFYNAEEDE